MDEQPRTGLMRLQKYLAQCGVLSRRAAEQAISNGRVEVNARVVRRLGTCVDPARDIVALDGRVVRPKPKLCVALHKPPGFVCSGSKKGNRRLIQRLLPAEWNQVRPAGRMDRDVEGLVLLTNDGDLMLRLTHPRHCLPKTYVATVDGRVNADQLDKLVRGVRHEGCRLRAEEVHILSTGNKRSVVELTVLDDKNRAVHRLFASLGLSVARLVRTSIGPIRLGELKPAKWRVLAQSETTALMRIHPRGKTTTAPLVKKQAAETKGNHPAR